MDSIEGNWGKFKGKRVYILLNNNNQYNGDVLDVIDLGDGIIFVEIKDKFGKFCSFNIKEIKFIQEKDG